MTVESNLENAVIGSKTEIWLNVIDFLGKKKNVRQLRLRHQCTQHGKACSQEGALCC